MVVWGIHSEGRERNKSALAVQPQKTLEETMGGRSTTEAHLGCRGVQHLVTPVDGGLEGRLVARARHHAEGQREQLQARLPEVVLRVPRGLDNGGRDRRDTNISSKNSVTKQIPSDSLTKAKSQLRQ